MFIAGIDGGGTHTRIELRDMDNTLIRRGSLVHLISTPLEKMRFVACCGMYLPGVAVWIIAPGFA